MIKISFFPEFRVIQNEINRIFDRFLAVVDKRTFSETAWTPLVDSHESKERLIFKIEVPGVEIDNLKVEIRSDYLFVEGVKFQTKENCPVRFLQVERGFGRFSRYVPINATVDTHSAKAWLKDGMLYIELKKVLEQRKRSIVIEITKK